MKRKKKKKVTFDIRSKKEKKHVEQHWLEDK